MAAEVQTENGIVLLRYDDLAAGRDLTAVRGHILSSFIVERRDPAVRFAQAIQAAYGFDGLGILVSDALLAAHPMLARCWTLLAPRSDGYRRLPVCCTARAPQVVRGVPDFESKRSVISPIHST